MQEKRTNVTKVMLEKIVKHGISPIIFAFSLLIGLGIINYITAVKAPSFDVTHRKLNTLSQQTFNLLDSINYDVTITAFYPETNQIAIQSLLEKYSKRNKRIKLQYIDPIKNPLIAEKYEVTEPRTIIFESGNKKSRLNPPPLRSEHNERNITIGLYRLTSEQAKTIYFTTGHGELSLTNTKQDGISIVNDRLLEQNYLVQPVNLLEKGTVPNDCSLLIIAGPTVSFTDDELTMVKKYISSAGSIIIMIDPGVKTNLDAIETYNGITFGNDYVYETSSKLTTQMGGAISPFCSPQDSSEITAQLPNQLFFFPYVRSVQIGGYAEGVQMKRLVASSENSWAETDLESAKTVQTNIKPTRNEKELKGPITVAAVTEMEFPLPDSLISRNNKTFKVRSAFFGNSSFIKNSVVTPFPSNLNLFLNTTNWITRNEKIIEVLPHETGFTPVELTQSERRTLVWLSLIIFPGAIVFIGFIVWYNRR